VAASVQLPYLVLRNYGQAEKPMAAQTHGTRLRVVHLTGNNNMVVMVGRGDPQEMWDLTWCRGFVFPLHVFTFVGVKGAYKREEKSALELMVAKGGLHGCGRNGTDNARLHA
jgi:hypothetical protein